MKLKDYKKNLKNEYQETFAQNNLKPKRQFQFKIRYAFLLAFLFLFGFLIGQHIYVACYNAGVEKSNAALKNEVVNYQTTESLIPIQTDKDYKNVVNTYTSRRVYHPKKESFLSFLFSIQLGGCTSSSKDEIHLETGPAPTSPDAPTAPGNDSYQTNVQVDGIDESDVAKCDGKYIYYLSRNSLYVYSIETKSVVTSVQDSGTDLYVVEDRIVSIHNHGTHIYEFKENHLVLKESITYNYYLSSRVVKDHLYLVVSIKADENSILYDDCYYDKYSSPVWLYSLMRINLKTYEKKETQLLSNYYGILYASYEHFYIATRENTFTSISIFNYDLEPLGIIHVYGTILNQFSMDEYENTFRVVSTDTSRNATELNAISIYDIQDEYKRIGYLDQGIGLGRQIVKSVRYEKNTCYVVTYQNTDPLYEIDCSDPTQPVIISEYKAPGYSNYLHTFHVNGKEYVLGLGYTDSRMSTKISVYEKAEETTQIGKDFIIASSNYYDKGQYINPHMDSYMFENHKALWFYQEDTILYLGAMVAYDAYAIFKIDVNDVDNVVSLYCEIQPEKAQLSQSTRGFLVDDIFYLIVENSVQPHNFDELGNK